MKSRDVFVSFGEEDSPTIENAEASFEVVNPPGEEDTALSEATPSSAYEEVICKQLRELLERCQSSWGDTLVMFRSLFFSFVFAQNWAVLVTCAMLAIACILQPISSTIVCTCLFIVLSASCVLLQGYIIWERVTEVKFRTADVINAVLIRWSKRIVEMRNKPSQDNSERRKVFLETFSHLPASAFRMFAVVDQRTLRLKLILKSLVVKRSKRLDEVTLSVRRYMEPKSICKLVDVMGITLESYAIVLRPLVDRARPPRLPNLLMSGKRFVEEEATTDESDGERESRTALRGGNSISVSHHMEYFVFRVFLLFWIVAMCFTIAAGILYYFVAGAPLGEGVFRDPSVALLGLLPLNATVVNRFLVLYANVYLDKLFHYIVCKKLHDVDDRLPRFSMWSALTTMFRVFFHRQPENGSRNPMVFSGSLVDGFGMASVVAMLDQTGIVTDMVLLPVQVLCLKGRQPTNTTLQSSSSSSSSDEEAADDSLPALPPEGNTDDALAVGEEPANIHTDPGEENAANTVFTGVSQVTAEAARERKKNMKRQIKRKKFQEERFVNLALRHSNKEHMTVEFGDEKDVKTHRGHLNSICLCILMHALSEEPQNLETWTEPFRFCDRTPRWVRAMYWLPRTCAFSDSVVSRFKVVARIFQIDTKSKPKYHNSFPEQSCSLLASDDSGLLHVFTMGTPFLVMQFSNTHWTGSAVEEFDEYEKKEILHTGKQTWEQGLCLETVAMAHRVLPARYNQLVGTLPSMEKGYSEFFFQDGQSVTRDSVLAHRRREKSRRYKDGGGGQNLNSHSLREGYRPFEFDGTPSATTTKDFPNQEEREDVVRPRRSASAPSLYTPSKSYRAPPKMRRSASSGCIPLSQPETDDFITPQTFIQLMASTSHTFLGLVGLRDSVRPNVQSAMSAMEGAGVRCMYFCSGNERQTKSFGSRVGLETDWNCCISLKEDAVALDPYSIRAQLPFGIKSIRKHILHVDPIPIQVNLFSHAHGVATRAMLSILQDNHEIVVAVGSVFNHSNVRSFVQADLSIGVLPTRRGVNAEKENTVKWRNKIYEPSDFSSTTESANRDIPLYRSVAELLSCSCSLRAPPSTSVLPIIATMVRQARLRLSGIGNCDEFIMHTNVLVVMLNSLSLVVGAPLLLTSPAIVFVLNVIIPILALTCTYTAYAGIDPMRTMTSRHNYFVRRAIVLHSAAVWCLRYIPSLVALLALGITACTRQCDTSVINLFSHSQEDCLVASQGYVALTLNYWLMIHCWTHISRHHPISLTFSLRIGQGRRSTYLFTSWRWISVNFLVTVLSVGFVILSTPTGALKMAFFPSPAHFVVSLLFPLVLLGLDIPIKHWREKRFTNMQKFRKLSFGTRLGMHSPRGDYEPEGPLFSSGTAEANAIGVGGEWSHLSRSTRCLKKLNELFFRYTTMRGGKLELNCVCCDHVGGNYATYHVDANI